VRDRKPALDPRSDVFLRDHLTQPGLKGLTVEFDRAERFARRIGHPLTKKLSLALQGDASFSAWSMRPVACVGLIVVNTVSAVFRQPMPTCMQR
jgi:hypothetical protein